MVRVKNSVASKKRKKKVLRNAKGYTGAKSRRYKAAFETSKEFYNRFSEEKKRFFTSQEWKLWSNKTWAEYKKANQINKSE